MKKLGILCWGLAGAILAIISFFVFKILYIALKMFIPSWIVDTFVIGLALLWAYWRYGKRNS